MAVVALVSWLPGAHPCLLCFGPPIQWAWLCHDITGSPAKDPRHQHCLEALIQAAVPLTSVVVGASWDRRDTQPNRNPAQGVRS